MRMVPTGGYATPNSYVPDGEASLWFWIRDNGSSPDPLDIHTAASLGDYNRVKYLIESDPTVVRLKNHSEWTPLMYSSYYGCQEIVRLLCSYPVDLDVSDRQGYSALLLACFNREIECIKLLLKVGADVDRRDRYGLTPLVHMTIRGNMEIIKILVESGADVNTTEPKQGLTPLMLAAMKGYEAVFEYLLLKGANLNQRSFAGSTAESFANVNGYNNIPNLITRAKMTTKCAPEFKLWPTTKKQLQSCLSRPRHLNIFEDYITAYPSKHQFCGFSSRGQSGLTNDLWRFSDHCEQQMIKGGANLYQLESQLDLFKEHRVEQVLPLLRREEIDMAVLVNMTDEDFRQIGICNYTEINNLLMVIERLRKQPNYSQIIHF